MLKSIIEKIYLQIEKGDQIAPFLFVSPNPSSLRMDMDSIIQELQKTYAFPSSYVFRYEDNGEALRIAQAREIVNKSHIKSDYTVQVFVIENASRMTLSFSNALLKFFEEPWVGNIVFLTHSSESGILDTILSRVQKYHIQGPQKTNYTEYIVSLIEKYVEKNSSEIVSYYFTKQLEKKDVLDFLYACTSYIKKSWKKSELISDISQDLKGVANNNFMAKYTIDRYLYLLKKPD